MGGGGGGGGGGGKECDVRGQVSCAVMEEVTKRNFE